MTVLSKVPAVAVAAVLLTTATACAAKSVSTAASSSPRSSSAAPSRNVLSASAVAVSPGSTLAKADFVKVADAVCVRYDKELGLVTQPDDDSDYAAISRYLTESMALYKGFSAELQPLTARTGDAATLESNWLAVDRDYVTQAAPSVAALAAAVKANSPVAAKKALAQLDAVPDHTSEITAFLKGYGLTDCAALEGR